MNIRNFNIKTIFALLVALAGIVFYLYWGITYGVWYDVGIYSLVIVLVLAGIIGAMISLRETPSDES